MITLIHPDGTEREVADGLAGLVPLAWDKGMDTGETNAGGMEDGKLDSPAFIVFPVLTDAVEFLLHVCHITEYRLGDNVVLSVVHPDEDLGGAPLGKVTWMPSMTPLLVKAWS